MSQRLNSLLRQKPSFSVNIYSCPNVLQAQFSPTMKMPNSHFIKTGCRITSSISRFYSTISKHKVKVEQRHNLKNLETVHTDIVIIGAGLIGTSLSSRLAQEFPNHVLLEKERRCGMGISSRNSEVIHGGLYYEEGSLKAEMCREGNPIMFRTCERWGVPVRRCGKWLIATNPSEHDYLEKLNKKNDEAGVVKLRWVKYAGRDVYESFDSNYASMLTSLERGVMDEAFSVLESVDTGIVNSSALMEALLQISSTGSSSLSEEERGTHVFNSEVLDIFMDRPEQYTLLVKTGNDLYHVKTNVVINAAGLGSAKLSQDMFRQVSSTHPDLPQYNTHFVKGDYFSYESKPNLVNRLLYPVPDKQVTSLGIHLTIDMNGGIRFGPDVEYLGSDFSQIRYNVDEDKRDVFYNAIQKYIPNGFIEPHLLKPAYAGIRPKLQGPGEPFRDFIIHEESDKNLKGFISLVGIESPGLTSCMAIANRVAKMIGSKRRYDFK